MNNRLNPSQRRHLAAMIGGVPYLMDSLERALRSSNDTIFLRSHTHIRVEVYPDMV